MSPIRPDLPSPRHAATQPVTTTSARVAQAAFFQQALASVKSAQETVQETARQTPADTASAPSAHRLESGAIPPRRPGALLDIRV